MLAYLRLLCALLAAVIVFAFGAGEARAEYICTILDSSQPYVVYLDEGSTACRMGSTGDPAPGGARLVVGISGGDLLLDPVYNDGAMREASMRLRPGALPEHHRALQTMSGPSATPARCISTSTPTAWV